jgi:hypothetical protein
MWWSRPLSRRATRSRRNAAHASMTMTLIPDGAERAQTDPTIRARRRGSAAPDRGESSLSPHLRRRLERRAPLEITPLEVAEVRRVVFTSATRRWVRAHKAAVAAKATEVAPQAARTSRLSRFSQPGGERRWAVADSGASGPGGRRDWLPPLALLTAQAALTVILSMHPLVTVGCLLLAVAYVVTVAKPGRWLASVNDLGGVRWVGGAGAAVGGGEATEGALRWLRGTVDDQDGTSGATGPGSGRGATPLGGRPW